VWLARLPLDQQQYTLDSIPFGTYNYAFAELRYRHLTGVVKNWMSQLRLGANFNGEAADRSFWHRRIKMGWYCTYMRDNLGKKASEDWIIGELKPFGVTCVSEADGQYVHFPSVDEAKQTFIKLEPCFFDPDSEEIYDMMATRPVPPFPEYEDWPGFREFFQFI